MHAAEDLQAGRTAPPSNAQPILDSDLTCCRGTACYQLPLQNLSMFGAFLMFAATPRPGALQAKLKLN